VLTTLHHTTLNSYNCVLARVWSLSSCRSAGLHQLQLVRSGAELHAHEQLQKIQPVSTTLHKACHQNPRQIQIAVTRNLRLALADGSPVLATWPAVVRYCLSQACGLGCPQDCMSNTHGHRVQPWAKPLGSAGLLSAAACAVGCHLWVVTCGLSQDMWCVTQCQRYSYLVVCKAPWQRQWRYKARAHVQTLVQLVQLDQQL
jgi:hypothetical protein